MESTEIIGIVLVKNEEQYIHQVLSNISHFCDKIIVADNQSKDTTAERVFKFSKNKTAKIFYHLIAHPSDSHSLIQRYAGSKTWIFAVDGDELYDPEGLTRMRKKILLGSFDHWWVIFGNVLNCTEINYEMDFVRGYLAPPCRSMTKLYNFSAIEAWNGPCPERLHGGEVVFKRGFSRLLRHDMYKEVSWEESDFRCLHLCFLQRSKLDNKQNSGFFVRKNISDMNEERFYKKILDKILTRINKSGDLSKWKQEKYMRGSLVQKQITGFFPFENV